MFQSDLPCFDKYRYTEIKLLLFSGYELCIDLLDEEKKRNKKKIRNTSMPEIWLYKHS